MSTTAGNLINLNSLVLSDTFYTWINKTNQIIELINPLQVYDVDVNGGILKQTGLDAGNYNGVITLSVNSGPGIGTRTYTNGQSHTIVDFGQMVPFGLAATGASNSYFVQNSDEFLFNAVDDFSGGPSASGNPATSGTVKKVQASKMFPPLIDSTLVTFGGNVTVNGSLTVNGASTYVAANNLQVQDKQIQFAFQQSIAITITGGTANNLVAGTTGFYFIDNVGLTANKYGNVQSFTGNAVAGFTGTAVLGYPFSDGDSAASFVGITGYLSSSSTGANRRAIESVGSVQDAFLSDENLSQAGIIARGASGDKSLLWIYQDDTGALYKSWIANANLGVDGNTNAIISRVFRSYGYTGISQSQFIYAAEPTKNPEIYLTRIADSSVDPLTFTGGTWKIAQDGDKNLVFSSGPTGPESSSQSFLITPGASGTTYPNVTFGNFASGLNVDMVDGAHARTGPTASGIPVSDTYGRLDDNWLNASSLRKRYVVAAHGLTAGDVIRLGATGYLKALADTSANAEAIGMVSEVHDSNTFTVTMNGRISGLSGGAMTIEGTPFSAGQVYFLSGTTAGKLIGDPDYSSNTRITTGQIRKSMLLATSTSEGLVLGYPGVKVPTPTDEVYLTGLVQVGTIHPYAGNLDYLTSEWLLCDGDRYRAIDYPDLYASIGNSYNAQITFASSGTVQVGTVVGGTRQLQVGDTLVIAAQTVTISAVNASLGTITVTFASSVSAGTYTLVPTADSNGKALFFVPDLRTRGIIGGSTGSSQYTSVGLTTYAASDRGGNETQTLAGIATPAAGSYRVLSGSSAIADLHTPFLVTHYIIRAIKATQATILTGHNHDTIYPRLDGTVFDIPAFRDVLGVPATSAVLLVNPSANQTTSLDLTVGGTMSSTNILVSNQIRSTGLSASTITGGYVYSPNMVVRGLTATDAFATSLTATNFSVIGESSVPTPTTALNIVNKDYVDERPGARYMVISSTTLGSASTFSQSTTGLPVASTADKDTGFFTCFNFTIAGATVGATFLVDIITDRGTFNTGSFTVPNCSPALSSTVTVSLQSFVRTDTGTITYTIRPTSGLSSTWSVNSASAMVLKTGVSI